MKLFKKSMQVSLLTLMVATISAPVYAGAQEGDRDRSDGCDGTSDVLFGQDNDNVDNPKIQPYGVAANQSLDNADVLFGQGGCDVLVGLLGNDVLDGGAGSDVLIGGTEQFDPDGFGNKDIMIGGDGNDINIWAPGDGSDAFLGGAGARDAQVFGVIDRDQNNVPILMPAGGRFVETGLPSVEVTGSPGFCRLEAIEDSELGFDFLVTFFVRASGNQAVTVRLKDVEQVFCTSEAGGQITYANLRDEYPSFVEVSQTEVRRLNSVVDEMIR